MTNFETALTGMKLGHYYRRASWKAAKLYVRCAPEVTTNLTFLSKPVKRKLKGSFSIRLAQHTLLPINFTDEDILATDWVLVDTNAPTGNVPFYYKAAGTTPTASDTAVGNDTAAAAVAINNAVTSVKILSGKTATQTLTVSGTDAAKVTIASDTITVNTTTIATTGGVLHFSITVSESTAQDKTYNFTLTVAAVAVAFSTLTANGTSGSVNTTALTITLDQDINLAAADITLTGATLDTVTDNNNGTYTAAISAITVENGQTVTVALAKTGYAFTPASKTVAVYKV